MKAIINVRQETGLTQTQLAERTGIAQSNISKFETGADNPSLKTIKRLAAGLGISIKIEFQPFTQK